MVIYSIVHDVLMSLEMDSGYYVLIGTSMCILTRVEVVTLIEIRLKFTIGICM